MLSTLATVLQSWDDHPHHRLTMPLHHGSLFLRWERWPVRQRCACDASDRPGRASELSLGFRHVGGADGRNLRCVSPAALSTSPPGSSPGRSSAA